MGAALNHALKNKRVRDEVRSMISVVVGAWYFDASITHTGQPVGAKFRVLEIGAETLAVVDEFGEHRTVNRMLFERQMVASPRRPM